MSDLASPTWCSVADPIDGDERLEAHWAAQLVAAPGTSLTPPAADYRHTALTVTCGGMLAGALVDDRRAAIDLRRLDLCWLQGDTSKRFPLIGQTLSAGLGWLSLAFGAELVRPTHELPAHPVGEGAAFARRSPGLAQWFMNAELVLHAFGQEHHVTPRCWPHHLDIAVLIPLDEETGEDARSIGVGMSPGDDTFDQPYFYVTPWPYPSAERLPTLVQGAWHTEGFVAAVLGEAAARRATQATVETFVHEAFAACSSLLAK
ncbi:MAG: hypothetical protein AAGF12_11400 [Myxococcota bacterium]